MVCCCLPCFHKLQRRLDPVPGSGPFTLCVTEAVRWVCIVVPLYMSAWRYAVLMDMDMSATFWGALSGLIFGFSLCLYLPLKVLALKYRMKNNSLKDYRWRPSIVTYILICALPCLTMILVAIELQSVDNCTPAENCTLDEITTTVLQLTILGLTITEWMSKVREEHITYDLITAMALDFFFAYDCIQFIMLCANNTNIYQSEWVYVCFVFAFVSMFRYVPAQPVGVIDKGSSTGAAINIVVSMICVDVPFVVVRLWTMIEFGLVVSDIIHPLKNFAMICFGCTQLYIIYDTRKKMNVLRKSQFDLSLTINRKSKFSGVWDPDRGDETLDECNDPDDKRGSCYEQTPEERYESAENGNVTIHIKERKSDMKLQDLENETPKGKHSRVSPEP